MKTKCTSSAKTETVKDEIVVDSTDVREAGELAVKRGHGCVENAEIIVDAVDDRTAKHVGERTGR